MASSSNFSPQGGPAVRRISVPVDPRADVPADFRAFHDLRVAHELALWGNADRAATLAEDVAFWRGNEYEERHVYLAWMDGRIVGCGTLTLPLSENTTTAGVDVLVGEAFRRRGFGSVILRTLEGMACEASRVSFDGYCGEPIAPVLAGAPLLKAKSGSGGVPADSPSTRFAVHHGYSLEQVETSSVLALPFDAQLVAALEADALAQSAGYVLVSWEKRCPDGFLDAFARLKSLMSTEVPIAGLGWEGEQWDGARVRQEEAAWQAGGVDAVVAAAQHLQTAELAAYTVLIHRDAAPGVIHQEDTLVDPGHRGHRLGMLVKIANLRAAAGKWPDATSVMTWNASENQHMLAINIAVGFKPSGFEGEWQKRLG
ncbi:GNAT family N-acetyltransferase [Paenarthrobacter sp. NPDC089675]|uniref:GNAT family N-acetyltransferase n=1 Tax=Paenarthrobacter sp. NPDC089675 TaxID=3364376 RepID=UPI0038243890